MTKIKLCGLKRVCDIAWVNELKPDYIGFVFVKESRRYVTQKEAAELKAMLSQSIQAVGVFVNARIEEIASIAEMGVIDVVQLHGNEDEDYISSLRKRINIPIIQAFRITNAEDVQMAEKSSADMVLLDAGAGCGEVFDWSLLKWINRSFFLAGGLTPENVSKAIQMLQPYGVDVSSALEQNGQKVKKKMQTFMEACTGVDKK